MQFSQLKRRKFFTTVLGGATAWSLTARAQQPATPVIGFLNGASATAYNERTPGFHEGLNKAGYVEGRNLAIEYRWAHNDIAHLSGLVADLLSRPVSIIAAADLPSALAVKVASTTIPIVFETAADPVQVGLVASLNRPAPISPASQYRCGNRSQAGRAPPCATTRGSAALLRLSTRTTRLLLMLG